MDLAGGESPRFSGRAVALLASRPDLMRERSGSVQVVAELAAELGFSDENGKRPSSIRSLKFLLPNFVFPQVERESGQEVPRWVKENVPDLLLPWAVFASEPPPPPPP